MDQYHVERIGPEEAPAVHALLAECGVHMAEQGFRNWERPYPLERLRADALERQVYAVSAAAPDRSPDRLLATFTIGTEAARPYAEGIWGDRDAPALYLNRLAVSPSAQGRRLGGWCMREIERRAAAMGCRAVRCDVLAGNARLRAFYERLGYEARGEREHSGWCFICYERLVAPGDSEPAAA